MPAEFDKVVGIIIDEKEDVDERCPGYQDALLDAIIDILGAVRQHRVKATNIQQKVDAKCNAVGQFLSKQRRRY